MAHIVEDRVRDVSSSTGTGTFTVSGSPPTKYRTFNDVVTTNGDTFPYAIVHQTANEWEVGLATRSAPSQFTRTTVFSSSNADAAVNFSSGTKDVLMVFPANPAMAVTLELGHPTDTTLSRVSSGVIAVEGSTLFSTVDKATTAQYLGNTADKILSTDQINAAGALFGLTDGANIAWNMASGFNASVTLGGNRTLDNPTNTIVGRTGALVVTQDGTGTRTLAYGTNWEAAGGTFPTLSTGAGDKDIIFYWIQTSTSIVITGILKDVA